MSRLYQEHPPRYPYHLTRKGDDLSDVLAALLEWGDRYERRGTKAPVRLEHAACGTKLVPVHHCPTCATVVTREQRRFVRTSRAQ